MVGDREERRLGAAERRLENVAPEDLRVQHQEREERRAAARGDQAPDHDLVADHPVHLAAARPEAAGEVAERPGQGEPRRRPPAG